MRAILISKGVIDVYALKESEDADPEVKVFFDKFISDKNNSGYVKGFIKYIKTLNSSGYSNFTHKQLDCWDEGGERFFELIKGPYRIGCFKYEDENKLLLVNWFRKKGKKAKKEYKRAVRLKIKFDSKPKWSIK